MAEAGVAITDLELRMTIKTLAAKGQSNRAIARQLHLCEGAITFGASLALAVLSTAVPASGGSPSRAARRSSIGSAGTAI
jgi:hypothetical protein